MIQNAVAAVPWGRVFAQLPKPLYRRTWFCRGQIGDSGAIDFGHFVGLLRQIDPRRARELASANALPVESYREVCAYCAEAFPLNELWLEEAEYEGGVLDIIPADVFGIDPWEEEIGSPALAACIVAHRTENDDTEFDIGHFDCLNKYASAMPLLGAERVDGDRLRCPRGRVWIRPWEGLQDLYRWANNCTGYNFLDTCETEMAESYGYPNWDADEIRSLAASWRGAKPIFERATALARHIDERPSERLLLLAGALMGDRSALVKITKPKIAKTLAEMFK